MLTRIYVDNFRCLVNFELKPGRRQLIMGANGSGKSSLMDAVLFLRRILVLGQDLERHKIFTEKTFWIARPNLTFEIEALLENSTYLYRLVIESQGDPPQARVLSEAVTIDAKPVFNFEMGEVRLFNELFQQKIIYPFDPGRSALATISEPRVNRNLTKFRQWFRNLLCFRINPFRINARAETEDPYPWRDLSNFGAWYRHLRLTNRTADDALHTSLQSAIDSFNTLQFENFGGGSLMLQAEFLGEDGRIARLRFDKLSDGQRCLVGLYTILHFVIAQGHTVILDEPDNFIALREIQPWLSEVSASIDDGQGQVLIISHHPELLDQWAPSYGVQFVRDGIGPIRIKEFLGDSKSMLSPSELVARGWENE